MVKRVDVVNAHGATEAVQDLSPEERKSVTLYEGKGSARNGMWFGDILVKQVGCCCCVCPR